MEAGSPLRVDASIFAALVLIGLCAAVPVAALYWLMRPTIVPNPGISAYRPPKPDPLLPLISRATRDPYAMSIAVAKRENELLKVQPGAAFALAQDARSTPEGLNSTTIRQQKRQRGGRTTHTRQKDRSISPHAPAPPFNSWAGDHSFATWYR